MRNSRTPSVHCWTRFVVALPKLNKPPLLYLLEAALHPTKEDELAISKGLRLAIILSSATLAMEVAGGIISNSLALLSDSGHVFLDMFALALSYYAVRLAMRPATDEATYGLHRAEVLASLANGVSLVFVAVLILFFASGRLLNPPVVQGSMMLVIAFIGLLANLFVASRIRGFKSLNVRSAYLHVLGDAFSSVAVVIGGIAIQVSQVYWVDPVLSFMIAALIAFGSLRIVIESVDILLEKVPRHMAPDRLTKEIRGVGGVRDVHDLHVWSICSNMHAISVHIVMDDRSEQYRESVLRKITDHLKNSHGIEHTTIQIECEHCGHENA